MVLLARILTSLDSSGSRHSAGSHLWALPPRVVCVCAGGRCGYQIGTRAHRVGCTEVVCDLFVGVVRVPAAAMCGLGNHSQCVYHYSPVTDCAVQNCSRQGKRQ